MYSVGPKLIFSQIFVEVNRTNHRQKPGAKIVFVLLVFAESPWWSSDHPLGEAAALNIYFWWGSNRFYSVISLCTPLSWKVKLSWDNVIFEASGVFLNLLVSSLMQKLNYIVLFAVRICQCIGVMRNLPKVLFWVNLEHSGTNSQSVF